MKHLHWLGARRIGAPWLTAHWLTAHWLSAGCFVGLLLALASPAGAKEEADRFLEELNRRGYGEVTLTYLDFLKQSNLLPEDVAENWDLYQSRGWRLAINEAFNDKEVEERTAKAKALLDKFLKDHPESPDVGEEVAEWGDMTFKSGLRLFAQTRITKDADKKDALMQKARAAFLEAKPRFEQAVELHRKNMSALQAAAGGAKGKNAAAKQAAIENAELLMTDAQLKLAKADFFLAMTYADDASEQGKATRKATLEKARLQFGDIYQRVSHRRDRPDGPHVRGQDERRAGGRRDRPGDVRRSPGPDACQRQ